MKFLLAKLGMDEFSALIREERQKLPPDPLWTEYLVKAEIFQEIPLKPPSSLELAGTSDEFQKWVRMNVRSQAQEGYSMVTVFLPLGDITARQLHSLAGVCRKYVNDTIRTTVDQNLLIRWVPSSGPAGPAPGPVGARAGAAGGGGHVQRHRMSRNGFLQAGDYFLAGLGRRPAPGLSERDGRSGRAERHSDQDQRLL